ncbi:phosphate signaling complex protein PhoU [Alicyclobacillus tolerans]|uniref:Phosphate-specific transport system accessory protein PhoU n=2 Tax=Alicyclobacillus tolerans TaxID=90970 RepID=A0ABT9LT60_9BACL|nr:MULTISPECIES: phosphate signaling complex protein PhoU [Alicyclobacillus]MDP9727444.1 phosphate transport system protein [Alicyclobacillus tengchongensis]QRF23165.1 phosphate signaling complex protein PhoU [Alicyclobacillus sp. TC]SHJ48369.1 phosphate uptake regulator, PhoU [Alicyclobacillus montanus]
MQQRQAFDIALKELKLKLLRMGGDVQEALRRSLRSLRNGNLQLAEEIIQEDKRVNRQEHEIEDLCIRLIATQQPVATDLRRIVAGMRIASDLERMGDLAVDISKSTIRLSGQQLSSPPSEIAEMGQIVDFMISEALQAYVDNDPERAKSLAVEDDRVDHLYRQVVERLFHVSSLTPELTSQAMTLAFCGRYLERVGDHATNIAEGVIYIVYGERSDLN